MSGPPPVNINKIQSKKRVLVAPLDWGLGHATRCIPVISELRSAGFEVLIAAEKEAADLLAAEFPDIRVLPLPGYRVKYSRSRQFFFFKMLFQTGKINAAIKKEQKWLKKILPAEQIDIVISDNRFGLSHKDALCIFMTHQLFIRTGNTATERIAQKINYSYINRFSECWVPDFSGPENLAGALSHPKKMPAIPVRYIGALSRFTKTEQPQNIDILAVISGPEPQRTLFENMVSLQLKKVDGRKIIVRGLPGISVNHTAPDENNGLIPHVTAVALNKLMLSAKMILSAGGYSTVMDLAALQQPALLIPTPGQKEQEYLAAYLSEKKYCISCSRKTFDLPKLKKIFDEEIFRPFPPVNNDLLKEAIRSLQ